MEKKNEGVQETVSKSGDMDLLQQKIDRYSDMLYRIAFLQLRNSQDAEDVVQETFYQFNKGRKEFGTAEHEKAWLIKVTLNGCGKVWRSAWYRHREGLPVRELPVDGEAGAESSMENAVLQKERSREIMESVMKLPVKYREVIHLFYYQQMSIKEIALATGRKESTVTSQLTRGRDMLKKNLKEEYRYE